MHHTTTDLTDADRARMYRIAADAAAAKRDATGSVGGWRAAQGEHAVNRVAAECSTAALVEFNHTQEAIRANRWAAMPEDVFDTLAAHFDARADSEGDDEGDSDDDIIFGWDDWDVGSADPEGVDPNDTSWQDRLDAVDPQGAAREDEDEDRPLRDANVETFQFADDEDDDVALVFRVTELFTHPQYKNEKAVVETPAPWDTPDDVTPANDVVKTLEWGDAHYEFDKDREAWTLDQDALDDLKAAAEDAGYVWEPYNPTAPEGLPDVDETLAALCEAATKGGHITVRYAKKNGNGDNVYEGDITSVHEAAERRHRDTGANYGAYGIVFEDTEGKTKRVKPDDDGTPSLYSSGYHPFMGRVLSVELISA